ncbi:hypothetical protein BGZ80_009998, partial [Entomortierella chlamydospora]
MGTRCNVYRHNKATQTTLSQKVLKSSDGKDAAPAEWWNIDIRTLEGRLALMECLNEVKA